MKIDIFSYVERITKLSTRKKMIILGSIIVVIFFCYWWFFHSAKAAQIKVLRDELSNLQAQLQKNRVIAGNLEKYKEEVNRLNEELKKAVAKLPGEKEIPSLLTNISDAGRSVGLEFLLFRPHPEVKKGFYSEVPIEIQVVGTYHQVALFFDKVSKMSRIVNIRNINMGSPKESGGKILLTTSCNAVTFRFLGGEQGDGKK